MQLIEGIGYRPESPGRVAFELNGDTYEIDAYSSGDELFFDYGEDYWDVLDQHKVERDFSS